MEFSKEVEEIKRSKYVDDVFLGGETTEAGNKAQLRFLAEPPLSCTSGIPTEKN